MSSQTSYLVEVDTVKQLQFKVTVKSKFCTVSAKCVVLLKFTHALCLGFLNSNSFSHTSYQMGLYGWVREEEEQSSWVNGSDFCFYGLL